MTKYEEERIAIYSYRASLRWAYVSCFLITTLILAILVFVIELTAKTDDTWIHGMIRYTGIMGGIALSGAVSVIVTIFILEVSTVLADIVGRRKAEERADKAEERADREAAARAAAEADLAATEAEVERLRRLIERNGSNGERGS